MKTILIARHAQAVGLGNYPSDFDRPLTDSGREDIKKVSTYLKNSNIIPEHIICSTAKRTLETAELIDRHVNNNGEIDKRDDLYGASVSGIISLIKTLNSAYSSIMIVGHNPTMTLTINKISELTLDYLPTSGVATIQYNISKWEDVLLYTGKILDLIYPNKITNKS